MKILLYLTLSLAVLYSCSSDPKIKPEDHFTRTYFDSVLHNNYYPVDFAILNDKSYLVLSLLKRDTIQSSIPGVFVMQTDKYGKSKWKRELPKEFVNAVPQLIATGGNYYFFAMHATSLETVLFRIDPASAEITEVKRLSGITYPLSCSRDSSGNIILLGFNSTSRSSTVSKLSPGFDVIWQRDYPVIEDEIERIIYHLTRTGKYYPFFTGSLENSTLYYVNCFSNYTFSLLFLNPNNGNVAGQVNGFRYDGGVSSICPITANSFAFTRFYYNEQFFLSHNNITTSGVSNILDYKGVWMPEIQNSLTIQSLPVRLNNQDVILIAAPTRSNTVGLYFYDKTDGKNKLTRFVGDKYPIEPAAVHQDRDGSIVLLCRIYDSGKYPRISLIKYAAGEFNW